VKCQVTNYDVWFNLMDSIRLFRILVFPSLKRGSRNFKVKSRDGRHAQEMHGMPKINLGITGSMGL